jgi:hypothetical protein
MVHRAATLTKVRKKKSKSPIISAGQNLGDERIQI